MNFVAKPQKLKCKNAKPQKLKCKNAKGTKFSNSMSFMVRGSRFNPHSKI